MIIIIRFLINIVMIAFFILVSVTRVNATTIRKEKMSSIIRRSDVIVLGEVISIEESQKYQ
jgi:hypothetical protein